MKILVVLLFLAFTSALLADDFPLKTNYGVWDLADSTGHYKGNVWYKCIECIDSLNCIAIGTANSKYQYFRRTTDGGDTWVTTYVDSIGIVLDSNGNKIIEQWHRLNDLSYPSKNLAVAVCDSGYYYRSTDNGLSWVKGKLSVSRGFERVHQVYMYDDQYGAMKTPMELYLTFDGGIHWNKIDSIQDAGIPLHAITSITMPTKNKIIVTGTQNVDTTISKYLIYISKDFGKNWDYYEAPWGLNRDFNHDIIVVDSLNLWCASRVPRDSCYWDVVFHSTDGGKSWIESLDTLVEPIERYSGLLDIAAYDNNNLVAVGPYFKVWRTSDGGDNWHLDKEFDYIPGGFRYPSLNSVAFPSRRTNLAVNIQNQEIYKYTETANNVSSTKNIRNINIKIVPNPANLKSFVNIYANLSKKMLLSYSVINPLGETITKSGKIYLNLGINTIPIKEIGEIKSSGFYWIVFNINNSKILTKPLIILK